MVPLPPPVRRRPARPPGPRGRPRGGGRPPPAGQRLVRPGRAAAGSDRPRAGRRRRRGRGDLDRGADAHAVRDHEHPPDAGGLAGGPARAGRAHPAAALPGPGLAPDPPRRAGTGRRLDRRGRTSAPRSRRRRPPGTWRGRRHARLHGHRRAGHGAASRHRVGGAGAGRPRAGRRGLPRHRRHQPGAGCARVGPARPGRTGLRGGRGGRAGGRPGPGQPDGNHPAGQRPATPRRPPAGAGHRPGGPGLGQRARRALDRWAAADGAGRAAARRGRPDGGPAVGDRRAGRPARVRERAAAGAAREPSPGPAAPGPGRRGRGGSRAGRGPAARPARAVRDGGAAAGGGRGAGAPRPG